MFGEERPDDTSLNSLPPAVDDPYVLETLLKTLLEIFFYNAGDIAWSERMEVNVVFEGEDDCVVERWLRLYGGRVVAGGFAAGKQSSERVEKS